ncbi:MAG: hypothetical protein ACP5NV_06710 [Candidatus Woesearchaeota archaeon]
MMLKNSFRIRNFWKIFPIEIIRYVLILIVIFAGIGLFIKSFYGMQPFLNAIDAIRATGNYDLYSPEFNQNIYLFNSFIFNSILILIIGVVLLIIINSVADKIIVYFQLVHSKTRLKVDLRHKSNFKSDPSSNFKSSSLFNKIIDFKLLLQYFYSYAIISIIFFTIALFVLIKINNLYAISLIIFALTMIYSYIIMIVQISMVSKNKFHQNSIISLRKLLRIDKFLEPILFSILFFVILFLVSLILLWAIKEFAFILIFFGIIYYLIWTRNYFIIINNNIKY